MLNALLFLVLVGSQDAVASTDPQAGDRFLNLAKNEGIECVPPFTLGRMRIINTS